MVSHYFRFMIYVTNVTVSLFIYALHHHQVTVQPHVHQLQGEQRGVKPTEYDVVQKQSHSCFWVQMTVLACFLSLLIEIILTITGSWT